MHTPIWQGKSEINENNYVEKGPPRREDLYSSLQVLVYFLEVL